MSFTNGMFLRITLLDKIDAAKIGKVAFLDPDTEIFPLSCLLPLIINFCIEKV